MLKYCKVCTVCNKSTQINLEKGPRRCECFPRGGLRPACVAEAHPGPCAVSQCAVAFIHEYACYARNFAACVRFIVEQSLLFCYFLIKPNFDLESDYIAKKPTNRAFRRYVCRTEMLSCFRIRIENTSPSATRWHFPL